MKKLTAVLLALLLFALPAFAEEIDYTSYSDAELQGIIIAAQNELSLRFNNKKPTNTSDFVYASNGKEVRINSFTGSIADLIIPAEIDGLPVTQLHKEAFYNNDSIINVYIPDSITVIPERCFSESDSISSIRFPGNIVEIGNSAFYECDLPNVLIIPKTVMQIGSLAFSWAHTKGIIIQSSFSESSWGSAFTSMDRLEFVYIKDGCNPTFSSDAFYSCDTIRFAIIPSSVTYLPDKIFEDAKNIKIITPSGSYAESFAMEHFLPVETESYEEYVAQYDGLYPD